MYHWQEGAVGVTIEMWAGHGRRKGAFGVAAGAVRTPVLGADNGGAMWRCSVMTDIAESRGRAIFEDVGVLESLLVLSLLLLPASASCTHTRPCPLPGLLP
jgi:hypothetical protein